MKNKLLFTFILCFLAGMPMWAQEQTTLPTNLSKKRIFCEGGINLYRLDFTNNPISYDIVMPEYYQTQNMQSSFFRGLNFKYYSGKNVLRCAIDYFRKGIDGAYGHNAGISRTGSVNAGYERLFLKARFSPYVFADLGYSYSQFKGNPNYYYLMDIRYPGPGYNNYFTMTSVFTGALGFGLRYNPVKSIVLNFETSAGYYFLMQKNVRQKSNSYNQGGFLINPVQLSLGFIF